ncbi:MAG: hypothetical protein ACXWU0_08625 [Rhodoplanes sp.]
MRAASRLTTLVATGEANWYDHPARGVFACRSCLDRLVRNQTKGGRT